MATETLQPDGSVFALTNMTGAATDVDEGVDSPDGVWLDLIDDATDCIVRASFPTPTGNPNTGADLQKFRVYVRVGTEAGGNDPTMDIAIRETGGGSNLAVQTGISVTSHSGEIIEFTWDASVLSTADGSAVEIYATGQRSGGSPSTRRCVEFDAIEWVVDYSSGPVEKFITPALVDQSMTEFGPEVINTQVMDPGLIDQPMTEFDPEVINTQVISPDLVQQLMVAFDPVISTGGSLPFTDDFTDTDGEPWDSEKWTTSEEGSVSANTDIQSNEGRLQAGTAVDDFSAATANSSTDIQDAEVLVEIDILTTSSSATQFFYVMLRSTGEQVAANAGRPASAYMVRVEADTFDNPANAKLIRRLSGSETDLDTSLGLSHSGGEAYFMRLQVEDVGADVVIRGRTWNIDESEKSDWDFEYTDVSPGALHGTTGVLQLVAHNADNGASVDVRVDDVVFVNLDGRPIVTLHESDVETTTGSPFTTGVHSPAANTLQLFCITTRGGNDNESRPTITGGGLTWTSIANIKHDTGGVLSWMEIFRAETGPSPGTFAVTSTHPNNPANGVLWHWFEIEGINLTTDNGLEQSATNLNTTTDVGTITSTFSGTPATDAVIVSFCSIQESNLTRLEADSGFTHLTKVGPSDSEQSAIQYEINNSPGTDVTGTWVGQTGPIGIISIELLTGVTGAQTISPELVSSLATVFDPTLSTGPVFINPTLVQQLMVSFDPVFAVNLGLVQQLMVVFDPSLIYNYDIDPALVSSLATAFDPSLLLGEVIISPSLVDSSAVVFDPVVNTQVFIIVDLVNQTAIVYDPVVDQSTPEQFISLVLEQQLIAVFDPVVQSDAAYIVLTTVENLIQVFGITVKDEYDNEPLLRLHMRSP